jgi:hypothetical protein
MKRDSLSTLYRDTMDALHPSADAGVEALRHRWARGEAREPSLAPEVMQELTGESLTWATYAYRDLERNGFMKHNYHHFLWRDADRPELGKLLAALAALEITALLRAGAMDMSKVQGELDYRHADIVRAAEGGTALPVTLALQRYFTTLVVSVGGAELMGAYVRLNKVSVSYGWANHLQTTDIEDIADWIVLLPEAIAAGDARKISRLCEAIKCLPFGAQLPDLAAA